jgi:hypothetical protein
VQFYRDPQSRLVRVHFRGEAGDRYMTPLAARVMMNQLGSSILRPEKQWGKKSKPLLASQQIEFDPPSERRNAKYHFGLLSVGASFLVRCAPDQQARLLNSLTSCRNWQQRKSRSKGRPKRFALRMTTFGIRVWRTA